MSKFISQRDKLNQIWNQMQINSKNIKNLNSQRIYINSDLFSRQISEIIIYQGEITQDGGVGG
jgi:hypothetical protein